MLLPTLPHSMQPKIAPRSAGGGRRGKSPSHRGFRTWATLVRDEAQPTDFFGISAGRR